MTNDSPRILIIAGPNGAGKTTFAEEFLPNEADCPIFVNADLIAAGISPFYPELVAFRAGRLMLEEIYGHVRNKNSFAFETTLSGRTYARLIPIWQELGYTVKLFFLQLDSVDLALARVKQRVRKGGHNVAELLVRRRYVSGLQNFHTLYKKLVDEWSLYENSAEQPVLIDEGVNT
jgi:predicted ABC-type ATPase